MLVYPFVHYGHGYVEISRPEVEICFNKGAIIKIALAGLLRRPKLLLVYAEAERVFKEVERIFNGVAIVNIGKLLCCFIAKILRNELCGIVSGLAKVVYLYAGYCRQQKVAYH